MHLKPDEDSYKCDFCQSVFFPEKGDDGVRVLGEPSDMNCPICNVALVQAALAKIRILYCTGCRGQLIPMQVFPMLVEELQSVEGGAVVQPAYDSQDLKRRINCPKCHKPMDTHLYAGPGNVVMDSCEMCELNWLDRGELMHIVRAPDEWKRTGTSVE
jgi:Zn-finger nucleic acid-binding protein